MGGAVKSVGNVVSSVIDPVSSVISGVAGSIPVVGPIAGPIAGYITGGPLGAATSFASNALQGNYSSSGGGGSSIPVPVYGSTTPSGERNPAIPGFNYGANTYTYGGNPYDASKYFVQGNKGVYNTLPILGARYNPSLSPSDPKNIEAYQNITSSMQGDPVALSNFQKQFTPQTTYSNYKPISYADFGLDPDSTAFKLAQYASQNKNPGFVGFQTPINPPEPQEVSQAPNPLDILRNLYKPVESEQRGPAPRNVVPTSVATLGSFRPAEGGSATATQAQQQQPPGAYKPVNIRTGGLATLRRSR